MKGPASALSAAALLLGLFASDVAAQDAGADTLRLSEVVRAALENNPMLHAARSSARAVAERIGPAGALPDPQLQFGLMHRMASEFGSIAEPMTMNQVQVMQMVQPGFRQRYMAELSAHREACRPLVEAARGGPVTLLYSARDAEHNGAVVLKAYLERSAGRARAGPAPRNRP